MWGMKQCSVVLHKEEASRSKLTVQSGSSEMFRLSMSQSSSASSNFSATCETALMTASSSNEISNDFKHLIPVINEILRIEFPEAHMSKIRVVTKKLLDCIGPRKMSKTKTSVTTKKTQKTVVRSESNVQQKINRKSMIPRELRMLADTDEFTASQPRNSKRQPKAVERYDEMKSGTLLTRSRAKKHPSVLVQSASKNKVPKIKAPPKKHLEHKDRVRLGKPPKPTFGKSKNDGTK